METKKYTILSCITICFCLFLGSAHSYGRNYTGIIPVTTFQELKTVLQNGGGGNIVVQDTIVFESMINVLSGTYTIDLNGMLLNETQTSWMVVNGGNLTINDSSAAATGKIITGTSGIINTIPVMEVAAGMLSINGGTIGISTYGYNYACTAGIKISGSGNLTVNGGTINTSAASASYAIWLYFNATGNVIINGGNISAYGRDGGVVIRTENPCTGTVTINGGNYKATGSYSWVFSIMGGKIIVNNGVFEGQGGCVSFNYSGIVEYNPQKYYLFNSSNIAVPANNTQFGAGKLEVLNNLNTYIQTAASETKKINIYGNKIDLDFPETILKVSIFNLKGELVYSQNPDKKQFTYSTQRKGIFILYVNTVNSAPVRRIIYLN